MRGPRRTTVAITAFTLGALVVAEPLWRQAYTALTALVDADSQMRQRERDKVMNEIPVGWGELLTEDGDSAFSGWRDATRDRDAEPLTPEDRLTLREWAEGINNYFHERTRPIIWWVGGKDMLIEPEETR